VSDDERATVRIAVIRAWLETGPLPRERVRMTFMSEANGGETRSLVVSSADDACAVIRHWLMTGRVDLAVDQDVVD
jgi:hypothetical protein